MTGGKSAIRSTARRMIAATTGDSDHSFDLDLAPAGRCATPRSSRRAAGS